MSMLEKVKYKVVVFEVLRKNASYVISGAKNARRRTFNLSRLQKINIVQVHSAGLCKVSGSYEGSTLHNIEM